MRAGEMEVLAVNTHAPLASWRAHPGSRLRLHCAACSWSKTYDPARIAERLVVRKLGSSMTPIAAIARHVAWPCPRCRRMRWVTTLVEPGRAPR